MKLAVAPEQPAGSPSQGQIIRDELLGRLRRGEIGIDDRLVDTALAAEFGVSRMPARDALKRLVHEGYLEATTRGFMLPRVTHREILEIFDLRRLLEPRAVALVAQAIEAPQLRELENCLTDARHATRLGNTELLFKASERFRNGWIDAVPNASLKQAIQRYMTQVQAVRMLTFRDPVNHPLIVDGNSALHEALANRDAVAAADHILRFVYEGERAYLAAVKAELDNISRTAKSA
ncbi:MAG: GntR family transcriptional regulator [Rhizobiaceae bacterium]|nr:GntR family transcriptional regulator [Rhizobiaceae bacterium]